MMIEIQDTETHVGQIEEWARDRTGAHRTTVRRWQARGWPPIVRRLAALELGGHLGLIHRRWQGWRIERSTGELVAPPELAARPFTPEQLVAAPILHQLQHELERSPRPLAAIARAGAIAFIALWLSPFLGGCAALAPPDDWTPRDTATEIAFQVVNAYDAHTTQRIHETPGLDEVSPLTRAVIGEDPEPSDTAIYFATVGLSHYLIARMLPKKWRPWFQGGTTALTLEAIKRNCDNGLCE